MIRPAVCQSVASISQNVRETMRRTLMPTRQLGRPQMCAVRRLAPSMRARMAASTFQMPRVPWRLQRSSKILKIFSTCSRSRGVLRIDRVLRTLKVFWSLYLIEAEQTLRRGGFHKWWVLRRRALPHIPQEDWSQGWLQPSGQGLICILFVQLRVSILLGIAVGHNCMLAHPQMHTERLTPSNTTDTQTCDLYLSIYLSIYIYIYLYISMSISISISISYV